MQNIQNIQKIQQNELWLFDLYWNKKRNDILFVLGFSSFLFIWMFWNIFLYFSVFCIINCYSYCVYRIQCLFLYIWIYFKDVFTFVWKMSQKCEQLSYELLFWDFWDPKWPPHPTTSPASMSKFPSGGKKGIENNWSVNDFLWF